MFFANLGRLRRSRPNPAGMLVIADILDGLGQETMNFDEDLDDDEGNSDGEGNEEGNHLDGGAERAAAWDSDA